MILAAVASYDLQAFDALQRVNARGTFVVNQQASLQLRDGGAIVNFSSSAVGLALPSYAAYAASRSASDAIAPVLAREGALFVMEDTRWDHGLTVTGEGEGLVGHAGAVLLRKLADQAGLTAALGSALARAGKFPLVDRGVALVSMAVAIALGATSMTDITLLAHHAPVLGAEPSDTTVRRTLELADPRDPGQDRPGAGQGPGARLVADRGEAGRVPVAGHRREAAGRLAGHRPGRHADHRAQRQGRSRAHVQDGLRLPSAGGLAGQYRRVAWRCCCGPGNAGSNTFADHLAVLTAAIRQIPARMRSRLLVRVDGAGASHELISHLLSLCIPAPHRAVHLRLGDHRGR